MTFTEVLVASLILSLAMVPVLKAMTQGHRYSRMLERKTQCLIAARNAIEQLRARAIENYNSSWSVPINRSGVLVNISAGSNPDLRTVTVTAGFDENQNRSLDSGRFWLPSDPNCQAAVNYDGRDTNRHKGRAAGRWSN